MGLLTFIMRGMKEIKRLTRENEYDVIQFYFSVPTGILKYGIKKNVPYVISLRGMDIPGFRKDKYRFQSLITQGINKAVRLVLFKSKPQHFTENHAQNILRSQRRFTQAVIHLLCQKLLNVLVVTNFWLLLLQMLD